MATYEQRWMDNILERAGDAKPSFERFVFLLRVQNKKDRTIYNYLRVLDRFLKWSRERKLRLKDWDTELAYQYIARMDNPHSRANYAFAIKRFFDLLEYVDTEGFKVPHRPKAKLPDILSEDDVMRLAKACDNVRDRALILVTYESTRRNHEVRGLRIRDVEFDGHGALATFHSTKGEDATIRLIVSASVLQTLIEHHKDRENPDAYVFYAQNSQITESRFRQIMRKAAKKAKIKRRVYPHLLRHSKIAMLKRENRLTDADIMNITGHTDRRQLDIYGKITMTMTNEKLLEIEGLKRVEKRKSKAKVCYRCSYVNNPLAKSCKRCGLPLDEVEARKLDEDLKVLRDNLPLLLKLVKEQKKKVTHK